MPPRTELPVLRSTKEMVHIIEKREKKGITILELALTTSQTEEGTQRRQHGTDPPSSLIHTSSRHRGQSGQLLALHPIAESPQGPPVPFGRWPGPPHSNRLPRKMTYLLPQMLKSV